MAHRVIAFVLGRVAIAAIIGFAIAVFVTTPINLPKAPSGAGQAPSQPYLVALATVTAALLLFFINRFLPMWSLCSK